MRSVTTTIRPLGGNAEGACLIFFHKDESLHLREMFRKTCQRTERGNTGRESRQTETRSVSVSLRITAAPPFSFSFFLRISLAYCSCTESLWLQVLYITHICELPPWPVAIAKVNGNNSMPGCFLFCFFLTSWQLVQLICAFIFVFPRVYTSAYCYVRVLDASNKLFFYI